ncbi:putative EamA domain-containing protein [Dioscorea sansibarensis]
MSMVGLQWIYAINALLAKAVLTQGMNPMVYTVYRQAMATLVLAPIALLKRRNQEALGVKGFIMVFTAALIGSTLNQFAYHQGLKLATSTMASAVGNLIPVITFVMAVSMGLEKVEIRSIRSMAKIFGTITCVGGAVFMAVFRGPKLLNFELHSKWEDLTIGFLYLTANNCCWSIWLILQVKL